MKIVFFVIALLMAILTVLGFNTGFARFMFANGSDGLMNLVSSSLLIRIFLLIAFVLLTIFYNKLKSKFFYFTTLIIVFLFWLLSGRMLAIFPDGRIITGWFYIETERIDICKSDIDCEKVYHYETKFCNKPFWRFRIKNKDVDSIIFTSPFISNQVCVLFKEKFANTGADIMK